MPESVDEQVRIVAANVLNDGIHRIFQDDMTVAELHRRVFEPNPPCTESALRKQRAQTLRDNLAKQGLPAEIDDNGNVLISWERLPL
jgi:hypothetical protein